MSFTCTRGSVVKLRGGLGLVSRFAPCCLVGILVPWCSDQTVEYLGALVLGVYFGILVSGSGLVDILVPWCGALGMVSW